MIQLANAVTEGLKDVTAPIRVAVMGCIVNGPGEAREADLGVASGNGKRQIFIKGKVIQTVPEDQIVETLLAEGAGDRRADGGRRPVAGHRHRSGGRAGDAKRQLLKAMFQSAVGSMQSQASQQRPVE